MPKSTITLKARMGNETVEVEMTEIEERLLLIEKRLDETEQIEVNNGRRRKIFVKDLLLDIYDLLKYWKENQKVFSEMQEEIKYWKEHRGFIQYIQKHKIISVISFIGMGVAIVFSALIAFEKIKPSL